MRSCVEIYGHTIEVRDVVLLSERRWSVLMSARALASSIRATDRPIPVVTFSFPLDPRFSLWISSTMVTVVDEYARWCGRTFLVRTKVLGLIVRWTDVCRTRRYRTSLRAPAMPAMHGRIALRDTQSKIVGSNGLNRQNVE
jgi:hypothetical protein